MIFFPPIGVVSISVSEQVDEEMVCKRGWEMALIDRFFLSSSKIADL